MRGTPTDDSMSMRDIAACLGTSTGWLTRCKRLAAVPDFERRLKDLATSGKLPTAEAIIRGEPVPARGRVDRAKGIFRSMTEAERMEFILWIARQKREAISTNTTEVNDSD